MSVVLDSLTAEEISQIQLGIPSLEDWGDKLFVPFEVRKLRGCRAVWINERWFLQRNLDITDAEVRQRLSNWLCNSFGFAVPREEDADEAFTEECTVFHADRYGSSQGREVHGGSGRAAVVGSFQAKGVGVTPLVGAEADWIHSHGCASLEEAVREAIYAEVFAEEFPHGAVPVVAILDTGITYSRPKPEMPEEELIRRAIIIRPAVLRPAHAERAPMFRNSHTGYANTQSDDAQRCRDVVRTWCDRIDHAGAYGVDALCAKIVEQLVFGQLHRMFNGGYMSSNLTIEGMLMDFGGARVMPNWVHYRFVPYTAGFGEEMTYVHAMLQSLNFHFNKYRPPTRPPLPPAAVAIARVKSEYERAFQIEVLRMWGLETETDAALVEAISGSMRRYMVAQQNIYRSYYEQREQHPRNWIGNTMLSEHDTSTTDCLEEQTLKAIQQGLRERFGTGSEGLQRQRQAWMTAVRLMSPREEIDRDAMQRRIFDVISPRGLGGVPDPEPIEEFISRTIGFGRRHWPDLPAHLIVMAHVADETSSALICEDSRTTKLCLWLQGIRCDGRLRAFSQWLDAESLVDQELELRDNRWNIQLPIANINTAGIYVVRLASQTLNIPQMQVVYSQVANRWCPGAAAHSAANAVTQPTRLSGGSRQ